MINVILKMDVTFHRERVFENLNNNILPLLEKNKSSFIEDTIKAINKEFGCIKDIEVNVEFEKIIERSK